MRATPLDYFFDESMTQRIPINENGNPIIDWGETEPGVRKEKTIFVKNRTLDRIILRQPYSRDEDFHILDFPPKLMGHEYAKVQLEFYPNEERLDPLRAEWGFDVLIG